VTVADSSPDSVCAAIAAHRVEVLPVSPTFINLLYERRANPPRFEQLEDHHHLRRGKSCRKARWRGCGKLSGCEVDSEIWNDEIGTMRFTIPRLRFGVVKIVAKVMQRASWMFAGVKAQSAMLGYLNAPDPFTPDGWFKTGDAVEVDGEWMRILGRRSEMINVGGEKVFPSEVEGVLQEMDGVEEVTVSGETNVIHGNDRRSQGKIARGRNSCDVSEADV